MAKPLELTNRRFGRLVVLRRVENDKDGRTQWLCQCDCGENHITTGSRLNTGKVNSCGCIQKETARKVMTRHGLSDHPLYFIRKEMIARCSNKNNKRYSNYGGRGITVCEEWLDSENGIVNFYHWAMKSGYREGLSIDRIDNDGNYEPSNCRWADNYIQSNNKSVNHYIKYNGKTKTLKQWSDELGISYSLLSDRIKLGWGFERSITTPPRKIRKKGA